MRELVLVRHGESAGNVAREAAVSGGADLIDIDQRDPDVPLSDLGREQAAAFGTWLAELPVGERPSAVWCSPYVRAVQTAETALGTAALDVPVRLDERLRDRELGILDRLTGRGIRTRFPDEAARRRYLGKMYYRPPGGESWADVALRLRSVLREIVAEPDERVLVVCHDAVILLIRYVLERLDEATVLELGRGEGIGNAAVTRLVRANGSDVWRAAEVNAKDHLASVGAPQTAHGRETDVGPR